MKARKSKLDPFAELLDDLELKGENLASMAATLAQRGCTVSLARLSDFLSSRRDGRREAQLFNLVLSGGRMNAELDAAFARNPAPSIEQLIKVTKTLIGSLQVQGVANPEMLSLANSMQATVLNFVSGQTRAEIEKQKLEISREKLDLLKRQAAQAEATESTLANAAMTDEQRAQRIKEIYGRA
jgi:hypothetical protein